MIPVYKPYLSKYKTSATKAINDEWISNHGEFVTKASTKLQHVLNVKHCILMANGTCATHCLAMALKFKHPDVTTVYIPNNVYVAVYNSFLNVYKPEQIRVAQIDELTWNINLDETYLKQLNPHSAIVVVHNMGNIVDVAAIKRIRPDIVIVEDNCEGLFGVYDGIPSGSSVHTLCSAISFYGNKTITTGEGGAFCTNDTNVYNYINSVYNQGMTSTRFVHDIHAYNYRMTNVQAGFLYDQLNDIGHILQLKHTVFMNYDNLMHDLFASNKITKFTYNKNIIPVNWMYAIRVYNGEFNAMYEHFKQNGIDTRPFFYSYNCHTHLANLATDDNTNVGTLLNREIIVLPSFPELTNDQQIHIVNVLYTYINSILTREHANNENSRDIINSG